MPKETPENLAASAERHELLLVLAVVSIDLRVSKN